MNFSILFPETLFIQARLHLLKELNCENMVIGYCGINKIGKVITFLVQSIIEVPTQAFDVHSRVFLQVKKEYWRERVLEAHNNNLHILVWHSHPFSNIASFSTTDFLNDMEQGFYLLKKLPHLFFLALVSGRENTLARIYTNGNLQEINNIKLISKRGYKSI